MSRASLAFVVETIDALPPAADLLTPEHRIADMDAGELIIFTHQTPAKARDVLVRLRAAPPDVDAVIKKLRAAQDMTQEQLAKKAGVTQGYVAQLERGLRKSPPLPTLKKLAKALGVNVGALLE